jgi:hypothetical protein
MQGACTPPRTRRGSTRRCVRCAAAAHPPRNAHRTGSQQRKLRRKCDERHDSTANPTGFAASRDGRKVPKACFLGSQLVLEGAARPSKPFLPFVGALNDAD